MCNNSVFQQKRKFNQLAKLTNCNYTRCYQINPRKFEVILTTKDVFKRELRFYVYFGDAKVTFKEVGIKMEWLELN